MYYRDIQIINNYADRILEKKSKLLNWDDWKIIGRDIKTVNESIKPAIAKRIVMSNIETANQRVLAILAKNNISENTAFEILNDALKIAKEKENSSDMIKIAKELIEIQDMKPNKVKVTETRQITSNLQSNFDKASGETRKITVQRDVNLINGEGESA